MPSSSMACCFPSLPSPSVGRLGAAAGPATSLALVPREQLFVSEPDPAWFGNPSNPPRGRGEGWTNENWLKSRFHFNFAEYHTGPSNFGVLRVLNDDLVQPDRGFGTHPHRDMEIMTFVVDGSLTHKDSRGNEETLGRGSLQFMTAGTGINHSEHNLDRKNPLRFIQIWVAPRRRGLVPRYGSMVGDDTAALARKDQWSHVVSDVEGHDRTPVQINQDCNVHIIELSAGASAPTFDLGRSRQAYMVCVEGEAELPGAKAVRQHDAARLHGPMTLEAVAGPQGALLLMLEMSEKGP